MNSFNAVHAFTELLKWIDLLTMRTYYNKIMFKVFKLILNINIEGKVCSPHNV